jgi:hypothetical protein
MPWKAFHIENEYCVFKLDDAGDRTGSSLGCHPTLAEANTQVAALNIAEEEGERSMNNEEKARALFDKFWQGLKEIFVNRRIVDVEAWDGSAANYDTTEAYCNACLINLNEGPAEDWTQANCKLPVRRQGDGSDTFVRQAVFAAAQRINQVDAPAEAIQSAARELIRAYGEMDEDPPESLTALAERAISSSNLQGFLVDQMFRLDEQIEGSDNYLVDLYHDSGGMYALYTDRGKLYRHQVMIQDNNVSLGERVEVMEIHQPVAQSRTIIRQQDDGRYRWFSVSATAVLNRSGEIDSRDLFDSFVAHAEGTGEYPIRQFYHQGDAFKTGQADFLARDGYCYITSGLFDNTPLGQAEVIARQAEPEYWGDSIGFFPTQEPEMIEILDGINLPVYRQGINKEISTLPENEAASLFTRTEVNRMSLAGKAWDAWLKLWQDNEEEARQWLEANPNARNRAIEVAGVITRQEDDGDEEGDPIPVEAETEAPTDEQPEQEVAIDEEVIEQLTQRVMEADFTMAMIERLEALESALEKEKADKVEMAKTISNQAGRIEALEADEGQKRQQWQEDLPARAKQQKRVVYRPRVAHADQDVEVDEMADWKKQKANSSIPNY